MNGLTGEHKERCGMRVSAFHVFPALGAVCIALWCLWQAPARISEALVLRIYDWKTGAVYAEAPARSGSRLFFGWVHSLEKIPWNEYYHVDAQRTLVLDTITFPAFGAGIPENKGKSCRVRGGLIYMEEIDQEFKELVWLNSHTATREIALDGVFVTRGSELPQHARLRLVIEAY
ncbi:MAG: DUF1850 domain-containing protein [Desulfovibrio sp.]|jgi:hypothetical protein|nr:DUF1850 domain-containing protein [Desulfovibrio sp.]